MALRVLLADESSTIKKVFQLALQDFAVDVRPVNVGVDVAPVAQTFKPDIIFADVLLQKRNGYEVALELKNNPALKNIPVVLMWSGFMELDEDKFQTCQANAQLEKPFDVAALRKLVTDLVPRTQKQRISEFLSFPQMPPMEEGTQAKGGAKPAPEAPQGMSVDVTSDEDFKQVPIPQIKNAQNEKFRLNLKPEELDPEHVPVAYDLPSEKMSVDDIFKGSDDDEEFSFRDSTKAQGTKSRINIEPEPEEELIEEEVVAAPTPTPAPTAAAPKPLSEAELEKIIRAQSAEIIESVVWKVVPEIATQIIEREINRLLKERDTHP